MASSPERRRPSLTVEALRASPLAALFLSPDGPGSSQFDSLFDNAAEDFEKKHPDYQFKEIGILLMTGTTFEVLPVDPEEVEDCEDGLDETLVARNTDNLEMLMLMGYQLKDDVLIDALFGRIYKTCVNEGFFVDQISGNKVLARNSLRLVKICLLTGAHYRHYDDEKRVYPLAPPPTERPPQMQQQPTLPLNIAFHKILKDSNLR